MKELVLPSIGYLKKAWGLVPLTSWFFHKSKDLQVGACNKSMNLVLQLELLVV